MKRLALEIVGGLLALLLVLEALFRLLPTSTASLTGYYIDPDILSYPAGHRWTSSTGWDMRNAQRLKANNLGFVSDIDFVANPNAVVLIGDSYIEASMLPASSRPGAQLQRELADRPVYAMGAPGTALLDHAERIRYAATALQARDFVVFMEPGDVEQSLCGSGNVHSQCLAPDTLLRQRQRQRQAEASTLKQYLRHSALAQYLVSQLKAQPAKLLATAFARQIPHGGPDAPMASAAAREASPPAAASYANELRIADRVADEFLKTVRDHAPGRVLIVVDGQRPPTVLRKPSTLAASGRFVQRARDAGLPVLELDRQFSLQQARSNRSISVGPADGHLNDEGVAIAVEAIAIEVRRAK